MMSRNALCFALVCSLAFIPTVRAEFVQGLMFSVRVYDGSNTCNSTLDANPAILTFATYSASVEGDIACYAYTLNDYGNIPSWQILHNDTDTWDDVVTLTAADLNGDTTGWKWYEPRARGMLTSTGVVPYCEKNVSQPLMPWSNSPLKSFRQLAFSAAFNRLEAGKCQPFHSAWVQDLAQFYPSATTEWVDAQTAIYNDSAHKLENAAGSALPTGIAYDSEIAMMSMELIPGAYKVLAASNSGRRLQSSDGGDFPAPPHLYNSATTASTAAQASECPVWTPLSIAGIVGIVMACVFGLVLVYLAFFQRAYTSVPEPAAQGAGFFNNLKF